jgi:hypothetical protein
MSIEKIYGKSGAKMVVCDGCGDGFEVGSWDEAQERMRDDGWKRRKIEGEWGYFCPDCLEALS